MKAHLFIIFVVSAILPATILMVMNCVAIVEIVMSSNISDIEILMLFNCLLGILGYIGLILLLLSHRYTPVKIIVFLLCGIVSFLVFTAMGPDNSWEWILTMQEPGEWFILVWPTIVSLTGIISLLMEKRKVKKAVNRTSRGD